MSVELVREHYMKFLYIYMCVCGTYIILKIQWSVVVMVNMVNIFKKL